MSIDTHTDLHNPDNRELEQSEPHDLRQAFEDLCESLTLSHDQNVLAEWIGTQLNNAALAKAGLKSYGTILKDTYIVEQVNKMRL